MICVRCIEDTARKVAEAPDGSKVWEVYYCENCNYSWRSTEEAEITCLEKRDPRFQLEHLDTNKMRVTSPIPPLKS
jgi:hypothetical protein